MKSIISGAVVATAIVALFTLQAKSVSHVAPTVKTIAASDTGKMANSKMSKMDKKKTSKMSTGKMSKKKMSKDSTGKM
jgi:hypothetical protein